MSKRTIKAHKGGRDQSLTIRLTADEKARFVAVAGNRKADWIMEMVERVECETANNRLFDSGK